MAKAKTSAFFCQNCGYESSKWMGQCPACREWNTFVEELVDRKALSTSGKIKPVTEAKPVPLSAIKTSDEERISTSMPELDRVLGGGVVKGSLVLVGGDPGIGKSTLLLQVCRNLSGQNLSVLYVSGEESLQQIKLRAERIGTFSDHLELLCETSLDTIRTVIERNKPQIVVIDSIQYTQMNYRDYILLKEAFPDKLFIFISHARGKNPKGDAATSVMYDADLKIYIEGYVAFSKGRYIGDTGRYVIWEEGAREAGLI